MLARLQSAVIHGLDAVGVDVEVDLSRGLPCWNMVGLAEVAVREARDRVRAAITNSGFDFPLSRITVNLAPADTRKDGTHYDLPVALGLLQASRQCPKVPKDVFVLGELALDGQLNPVRGALSLALFAKAQGFKKVILPKDNAQEAVLVPDISVLPAGHLLDVVSHISGKSELVEASMDESPAIVSDAILNLADIRGQYQARRALEIAAAGGHNLLLSGPPGVGKTMLAKRIVGILPALNFDQTLDVARIYSVAGNHQRAPMDRTPPFRAPHHSASDVAIIGGGTVPRPGEVSRAHHGVLFLDELPEFGRQVLEVLRQPLEEGVVSIARAADTATFPADFQLVGAMNPCPCGFLGHPAKPCRCTPTQLKRYQARVSGPLMDRMDVFVHVPPVAPEDLTGMKAGERSELVRDRVAQARDIQRDRLGEGRNNAGMTIDELERYAALDEEGSDLLQATMQRLHLSARTGHRMLKVARTIADLANADRVGSAHLAEALQFRPDEAEF